MISKESKEKASTVWRSNITRRTFLQTLPVTTCAVSPSTIEAILSFQKVRERERQKKSNGADSKKERAQEEEEKKREKKEDEEEEEEKRERESKQRNKKRGRNEKEGAGRDETTKPLRFLIFLSWTSLKRDRVMEQQDKSDKRKTKQTRNATAKMKGRLQQDQNVKGKEKAEAACNRRRSSVTADKETTRRGKKNKENRAGKTD